VLGRHVSPCFRIQSCLNRFLFNRFLFNTQRTLVSPTSVKSVGK